MDFLEQVYKKAMQVESAAGGKAEIERPIKVKFKGAPIVG
jgi:hypothetical protein